NMASRADKEKEVIVAEKGLRQLRKGTKESKSSTTKAPPARRFGEKFIEEHGLKWFNAQKEATYAPEIGLMRADLHLSSLISGTLS
ncbi:hypothetical protein HAX54_049719, partial [Datura stramonium]|nr:hypothetical protein [Datura stramonium]